MNFEIIGLIHFDLNYIFFVLVPGLAISFAASWFTKSTFNKYKQIPGSKGSRVPKPQTKCYVEMASMTVP